MDSLLYLVCEAIYIFIVVIKLTERSLKLFKVKVKSLKIVASLAVHPSVLLFLVFVLLVLVGGVQLGPAVHLVGQGVLKQHNQDDKRKIYVRFDNTYTYS